MELEEADEGDENADPEQQTKQDQALETETIESEKRGETDIDKEYDMDNYDDGEHYNV